MFCKTTSGQCSFEYRAQPPSTTLQSCNPYNQGNVIRISLECTVRRQSGVSDQIMIRWFRKNTTGAVEDLGLGDPVMQRSNDWTSRYHEKAFLNQPYSPSLLGKYWCQVINTTADPDQPLMKSNVFTLLAPGNYSGPTCMAMSTIQQVDNITCADLPDDPLPVQTTPLVLSSTTQLTSSHDLLQPVQLTTPLVLSSTTQPTSSHDLQPVQLTTALVQITTHSTGQQPV